MYVCMVTNISCGQASGNVCYHDLSMNHPEPATADIAVLITWFCCILFSSKRDYPNKQASYDSGSKLLIKNSHTKEVLSVLCIDKRHKICLCQSMKYHNETTSYIRCNNWVLALLMIHFFSNC